MIDFQIFDALLWLVLAPFKLALWLWRKLVLVIVLATVANASPGTPGAHECTPWAKVCTACKDCRKCRYCAGSKEAFCSVCKAEKTKALEAAWREAKPPR